MFTIYGGKTEFNQWDLEQLVTCSCLKEGDEVVFRALGKAYETTAFVQDGKVLADVPNHLLQKPCSIQIDLGWGLDAHMDCRTFITVVKKDKPADYVCPYNIKPRNNSGFAELPFYETKQTVEVLAECTVAYPDGGGEQMIAQIPDSVEFAVGEEYTIIWDSTEYICVAVDGAAIEAGLAGAAVFGNVGAMTGGTDTGEPFVLINMKDEGANLIAGYPLDGSTSITLSIKQEQTVVTPIDGKYLPNGVPYVEETVGMVEVLAECQPEYNEDVGFLLAETAMDFTDGEIYAVTFNGTVYECVAQEADPFESGTSSMFLGDASAFGVGESTGEPFMIMSSPADNLTVCMSFDESLTSITLSIKQEQTVAKVNKMDRRCLPEDATVFYLTSPNGTKFAVTVSDDGALSAAEV